MISADSRYAGQVPLVYEAPAGPPIRWIAPRVLPDPDAIAPTFAYPVTDSDRIDLLAWRFLGAPTLSWRIADANRAMHPGSLPGAPGGSIAIPVPTAGATPA